MKFPFKRWIHILSSILAYRKICEKPIPVFIIYSPSCLRVMEPIALELQARTIPSKVYIADWLIRSESPIAKELRFTTSRIKLTTWIIKSHKRSPIIFALNSPISGHQWGNTATTWANSLGKRTMCIQHGGIKHSSMKQLSLSPSPEIIAWSEASATILTEKYGRTTPPPHIVSPPCLPKPPPLQQIDHNHILLATCLHTEYGADKASYDQFLHDIFDSLEQSSFTLSICMHPRDKTSPNQYKDVLKHYPILNKRTEIFSSNDNRFYTVLAKSGTLLTRASTAAEEAAALGRKVILYDIESKSVRFEYDFLEAEPNCYLVQGRTELQKALVSNHHESNTEKLATRLGYASNGKNPRNEYARFFSEISMSKEVDS
ncbi:hypothetical protein MLD52_10475 [Puniceicoccaceae bacterium K14]|nr:hypothetical protein [Puniceicoccaceae bacterium K14]